MKQIKRIAGWILALVMVMAMAGTALAEEPNPTGSGSITIQNTYAGETYTVYKLFNATTDGKDPEHIAYTVTDAGIPEALKTYFTVDNVGNVTEEAAARSADGSMSEGLAGALKTWASGLTNESPYRIGAKDGTPNEPVKFTGLGYGYYVVVSTMAGADDETEEGTATATAVSVVTVTGDETIYDKNERYPKSLTKAVDKDNVNIGDTVTYTVTFEAGNYYGDKKITSYTISDTLPSFLESVTVTSIVVKDGNEIKTVYDPTTATTPLSFSSTNPIVIDWYDEDKGAFPYSEGVIVTITYTAVVTKEADIDGNGNTNTVTLTWQTEDGKSNGELTAKATIYTYAIALKKVNEKGDALEGAVFKLPFYVEKEVADTGTDDDDTGAGGGGATGTDSGDVYIYAGTYTEGETAPTGSTNQVTTPESGVIVIKGVASGTYTIKEVTAPDGYNKLTGTVDVTVEKTSETSTDVTYYLDEDGKVVETSTDTTVTYSNNDLAATVVLIVNKAGTELPSTGGMGTTVFYVVGAILVLGAGILLITKRRMNGEK